MKTLKFQSIYVKNKIKNTKTKKFFAIIAIAFCIFSSVFSGQKIATSALTSYDASVEESITDTIKEQLQNLDFKDFESFIANLTDSELELFSSNTFLEKIWTLLKGDYSDSQTSFFKSVADILFSELTNIFPYICLVIGVVVTFSLVNSARPQTKNKSISNIIHFVCFGTILIILLGTITSMINLTNSAINNIKIQMEIIFPIMLTIMTGIGGVASVSVYQPAAAILTSTIGTIFASVLMPIFIFKLIFSVVSNLNSEIKLDKFESFCGSLFKWIIGIVFTIFSAFITIQGITAGGVDGISYQTAKYTIKNTVPLVGGYISDSFNLIIASSGLIKNAIGAAGLLLLLSTIILPIFQLVIYMFSLKLAAALLEPIADKRIINFISSLAKSISLLIVMIVCCSFMYLLLVGLMMGTVNYF